MQFKPRPSGPSPIEFGGLKSPSPKRLIVVAAVVLGLLLVFGLFRVLCGVLVDYWWFRALDFGSVYTRILLTKILLWWLGFGLAFGATASGFIVASRITGPLRVSQLGRMTIPAAASRRLVHGLFWAGAVLVGFVGGRAATDLWHYVLVWLGRVPFGAADPIFSKDVGFYVFTYPLAVRVRAMVLVLTWVSIVSAGLFYVLAGALAPGEAERLRRGAASHLSKALGVVFLLVACGHFLGRYALLYSTTGVVFGPGYVDVHARLPACWVMIVASVVVTGVLFIPEPLRRPRLLIGTIGGWVGCMIVFVGVWPGFLQKFRVEPNELTLETPYIEQNIAHTLDAYGLDDLAQSQYPVVEELSYATVVADEATMGNVRLWDWRPLLETYRQIQEIRSYYDFADADVDRYELGSVYTQVLLSVRELNTSKLAAQAQTWPNTRLQFTHGYGLCMSPVNEHTAEGFPALTIKDIPPATPAGIELDRPQIYYGERTSGYVFVNTDTDEFDYPLGETNETTRHEGRGGVPVGGLLRKLMFALQFADVNILLSDDLRPESRVMYRRMVAERVHRLAPYLLLDQDPYPVVHDGRVHWIQDAYTVSGFYPYSDPTGRNGLNYIRNSVKAVVDAYHGTVALYVSDDDDPLIRAYGRIFPGIYRPIAEMPEGLRRHIRYPVDFFDIQTEKFAVYHMRDPRVFYNREDTWEVPMEKYHGQERRVPSYYIIMRLPGEREPEFILMRPFTPRGKDNMIAWLAGRSDGEHYGKLVAYTFPKQKLIYGPRQVEARIDQDPDISQQLTLWGQAGSSVIRGNLVVIPIAEGILYVEPLYIQAETAGVPQLKRVITAYGERVAMAPTLHESLRAVFAQGRAVPEVEPVRVEPSAAVPADAQPARSLLADALGDHRMAQEALARGDWAEYGRRMDEMKAKLDAMASILSVE